MYFFQNKFRREITNSIIICDRRVHDIIYNYLIFTCTHFINIASRVVHHNREVRVGDTVYRNIQILNTRVKYQGYQSLAPGTVIE